MGYWQYYGNTLIIFITPLVLTPLPIAIPGKESLAGYIMILMGTYWCTEVLPLGVTALIPIFLVPLFGIMSTAEICESYLEKTTMMMAGGFLIAIAIEKCELHRRLAINILMWMGTNTRWLMLAFMIPTWFLSMWISNTAASVMMMPIAVEVIDKLEEGKQHHAWEVASKAAKTQVKNIGDSKSNGHVNDAVTDDNGVSIISITSSIDTLPEIQITTDDVHEESQFTTIQEIYNELPEDPKFRDLCKALVISVAYAANVGGTGTLIGTGPNLVLKGQADELWEKNGLGESPINFASWLVIGIPLATLNLLIVWIWLELYFLGVRELFWCFGNKASKEEEETIKTVLKKEYDTLGPMRSDEISILILFVLLVLLWFFREPGFMPGWAELFKECYIEEAVPAILIAVITFALPASFPSASNPKIDVRPYGPNMLLDWKTVKEKMPWDVVLLLGGGFALADSTEASGLSQWLGEQLTIFGDLPDWIMVMVLGLFVTIITQFTSNVATGTLLLPIAASMAEDLGKNPLYLMITVSLSVQFAFMLPVATAPNAVAFFTGKIKVLDLVKAGAMLNILCVLTMTLCVHTWAMVYFDLDAIPWGDSGTGINNETTTITIIS